MLWSSRICLPLLLVSFTSVHSFSLNISDENPTAFSPTIVTWTRESDDPTGWWLDEHDVNNPSNKLLSIQVDNSGSTNGTVPFVFIRKGTFQIVATNTGQNDGGFFTSTPITVGAVQNVSSSSCPSPSSSSDTVQSSPAQSSSSDSSGASTGALVGAVIGSLAFGLTTGATIMFLFFRRRIARLQAAAYQTDKSEKMDKESPTRSTSRLNPMGTTRNNPTITPFTAMSPSSNFSSPASKSNQRERFVAVPGDGSTHGASSSVSWAALRDEKAPPTAWNFDVAAHDNVTTSDEQPTANASYQNVPASERQRLLEDEANRLRLQVLAMVNQALSTGEQQNDLRTENRQMAAEMERMKAQIEMLEAQQNSDWAQGLTDEPPSYFTSIAS